MSDSFEKMAYATPLDEIYSIRRMISEQYGPDVQSISRGVRMERRKAEEEGFVFVEFPVARHRKSSSPVFVAEDSPEYDAGKP